MNSVPFGDITTIAIINGEKQELGENNQAVIILGFYPTAASKDGVTELLLVPNLSGSKIVQFYFIYEVGIKYKVI